jgi:hypothetical protein
MTRWVFTLWLAVGMAPGLGEVAESAVHLAISGHLAHTDAEHDLADQGREHGCDTTQHHCSCCASQVAAATPPAGGPRPTVQAVRALPRQATLSSIHLPAPPTRPPIYSA